MTNDPAKRVPRWQERLELLSRMVDALAASCEIEPSEVEPALRDTLRSGIIKEFELSFELAWKAMKDYAQFKAIEVLSPRDSILEAWRQRLIPDEEKWLEMARSRNLFVHLYDKTQAEAALTEVRSRFLPLLQTFVAELQRRLDE